MKGEKKRRRKRFPFFTRKKDEGDERREEPLRLSTSNSTTSSADMPLNPPAQILVSSAPTSPATSEHLQKDERQHADETVVDRQSFCSTFPRSYLERFCSTDTTTNAQQLQYSERSDDSSADSFNYLNKVPDDPSVQESIECVIAATELPLLEEAMAGQEDSDPFAFLQTPSSLQQCLLRNRSITALPPRFQEEMRSLTPRRAPERRTSSDFAFLNLADEQDSTPAFDEAVAEAKAHFKATETQHSKHCVCCDQRLPVTEPSRWPQRPLLMRPTPHSGTVVKGIRYSGSTDYLWEAQKSALSWPDALHQKWNGDTFCSNASTGTEDVMCPHCMIMPINNGKELPGESLVTDFESPGFVGSILVRLRDSNGTTCPERERAKGDCYFDGVHRKYQVVVRGQFKEPIPWSECLAGFQ